MVCVDALRLVLVRCHQVLDPRPIRVTRAARLMALTPAVPLPELFSPAPSWFAAALIVRSSCVCSPRLWPGSRRPACGGAGPGCWSSCGGSPCCDLLVAHAVASGMEVVGADVVPGACLSGLELDPWVYLCRAGLLTPDKPAEVMPRAQTFSFWFQRGRRVRGTTPAK